MADIGQAPQPPMAPGAAQYNKLISGGFSAQEANEWRAQQTSKLSAGGFSAQEISDYWGEKAADPKPIADLHAQNNDVHQATNPLEMFLAGFQMSDAGLTVRGKAPDLVTPQNASTFDKVLDGLGQVTGDLPLTIAGFAGGAAAGAGVPGVGETGGSELAGGYFGAGALPQAYRETLLDYYKRGEYHTWDEFAAQVAKSTWNTAKAGVVSLAAGKAGEVVGGAVAPVAKPWLAHGANATAAAAAATSVNAALEGRVPNAQDFVVGTTTMLGLHAAGVVVNGRFVPNEAGQRVQSNLENIYRQTGIPPWKAAKMAQSNPGLRDEILGQDVHGNISTPYFRQAAPDEPEPFKANAHTLADEHQQQKTELETEAYLGMKGADLLERVRSLENSGDTAISPAGAIGRYQIMPGTARQYGFDPSRLTDPVYNEQAARHILADLSRRFRGDPDAILAAYNAGPGVAAKLITAGPGTRLEAQEGPHGWAYNRVPANRSEARLPLETQEYLARGRAMGGEIIPGGGGGGKPPGPPKEPAGSAEGEDPMNLTTEMRLDRFKDRIGEPGTGHRPVLAGLELELDAARKVDRQLVQQGLLDPSKNLGVEDMTRQTFASEDRANHFFFRGPLDPITFDQIEGPSLKDVADEIGKQGVGKDEFNLYLASLRTIEKAKQGIDTGIFPGGLKEAEANAADPNLKKLAPAVKMFQDWTNSGLQYVKDSGGISAEQLKQIKDANTAYISLRRVMGDDTPFVKGRSLRARNPIAKMEGSDRKIVDPWLASIDNMRQMIRFADRNRAAGAIVNAGRPLPEGLKEIEPPKVDIAGPNDETFKPYYIDENAKTAFSPFVNSVKWGGTYGKTTFPYYDNGKLRVFEAADENLARLYRGAETSGEATIISKVGTLPARMARAGIVADPTFGPRVALRHQLTAFIADPLHPPPFVTMLGGIFDAFGKREPFWDLAAKGGLSGSITDLDKNVVQSDAQRLLDETGTAQKLWNTFNHPLEMAQWLTDRLSQASRIGYYKRATTMGIEPAKAAMMARKAYLDYDERFVSSAANMWAKWVPFFHADVLGMRQGWDAVKPGRLPDTMVYAALGLVLPQIAMRVANYYADQSLPDGKKYTDLPQWERNLYFVTPPIFGQRVQLAKPYNFGPLIGAPTEAFIEHELDKDPHAFDGLLKDMTSGLPLGLPTIAQAPLENVTNYSFFLGRPLIPDSLKDASSDMQYTQATSEPAKMLAQLLGSHRGYGVADWSPIQIDNLVRGWTGTLGIDALKVLSAPFESEHKPWEMSDIPFAGSFFVRNPGEGSQPIENFYTDMHKFEQSYTDAHLEKKQGDYAAMVDDQEKAALYRQTEGISRALSTQRAVLDGIYRNKEMSNAEKQQATDAIIQQMILLAKSGDQMLQERSQ